MSTKGSLAYGKRFHLYEEALESGHIYLELQDVSFEATNDRVTVAIPAPIWECIRRFSFANTSLADFTDDMIQEKVEKEVRECIKRQGAPQSKIQSLMGLLPYGSIEQSEKEQIAHGLSYYQEIRDRQRLLQAEMDALNADNPIKVHSFHHESDPTEDSQTDR